MPEHIRFNSARNALELLDQRLLPLREETISCESWRDVIDAIKKMAVRGAPALGVAAAWACYLAALDLQGSSDWRLALHSRFQEIAAARPTAVNLAWAVRRMAEVFARNDSHLPLEELQNEARAIQAEDVAICRQIGANGANLIADGDTVLTHCNAGALATAGYGTALGVIRAAVEAGKKIRVIADETRPLLQGVRLTAWELQKDGIPVSIACDDACALLMSKGLVNLVIVGADRIAANGDTANKIGTFGVAIIANYFRIPFYIAAPLSTIDANISSGAEIPIEERAQAEVLEITGVRVAPVDSQAFNFAFDVTPHALIDGIITEAGILRPPYQTAIARALKTGAS